MGSQDQKQEVDLKALEAKLKLCLPHGLLHCVHAKNQIKRQPAYKVDPTLLHQEVHWYRYKIMRHE